ncbi:MAG: GH3 auxin-responsive promoter family protein [Methanobrevibacter sp.]|jgi:hypothetical protein|nr:GH3 auxin-responsive promoter family protein [Candidatus Methanovirga basalitermitum]
MSIDDVSFAGKFFLEKYSGGKEVYENLLEMTKDPMKYNEEFLFKILDKNKNTEYGQKYDFANIKSIEEYQSKIPLSEYDDYVEYILSMIIDNRSDLITADKVDHYSKSSGTLGNPKKIPCSASGQEAIMKYSEYHTFRLIGEKLGLDWIDGRILNLSDFSIDEIKPGITYGAVSSKMMMLLGKKIDNYVDLLQSIFTSPIEGVFPEPSTDVRYIHARFALMDENIVSVLSSFYSIFLELLVYIEENWKLLVKDINKGTIDESIKMSNKVRESLLGKVQPMSERADALNKIFEQGFNEPIIPKIWPKMKILVGIGTGGFFNYTTKIKKKYAGKDLNLVLLGLISSESIVSVPIDLNSHSSAILPDVCFFEFKPVGSDDVYLTLDKLEEGKDYELIITNLSGFYRYKMGDVIRVTGRYNNLPLIQFLYRSNQNVSLAGEKTTEIALREAAERTMRDFNIDLMEFSMYPDPDSSPASYVFFLEINSNPNNVSKEDIRDSIEEKLSNLNPSYGDKIEKNVLGKMQLHFLHKETYLLYRDLMITKGISSNQLKPPRIIVNEAQRRFFFALTK